MWRFLNSTAKRALFLNSKSAPYGEKALSYEEASKTRLGYGKEFLSSPYYFSLLCSGEIVRALEERGKKRGRGARLIFAVSAL